MSKLSPEYRVATLIVLAGLVAGFMGLACSRQIDAETTVPPVATACIEIGAEATAIAFVASLPEGTRQSAEGQLTRLAPEVPDSICPTATDGPDMEKTMDAALATLIATTPLQP